jgi:hypothetical protein
MGSAQPEPPDNTGKEQEAFRYRRRNPSSLVGTLPNEQEVRQVGKDFP